MLGGLWWIVRAGRLPPAEFSFSNETEIKSLDPHIVTGQPEGRIMWAIHEGLIRPGPQLQELPGVAERWDVSEDGLTYTFYLRRDARWSNGDAVTAADFVYSVRRMLDPTTASEYAYQAWYLKGAEGYTKPATVLAEGMPVEVELPHRPDGAARYARGVVLRGELVEIVPDADAEPEDPRRFFDTRTFIVQVDGRRRAFRVGQASADAERCRQLLPDFSTVGYRALDDWTIEMTLTNPTPYWLQLVGFYTLMPVHQATIEQHGAPQWTFPENIVTNGPYRVAFRRLRDRIRLEKNPYYWNHAEVAISTIDAMAAESPTTAYNLYATGQIDWMPKAPPLISRELLQQDPPRDDLNLKPVLTSYYYVVNCQRPPLDDPRVRQALSLAMDRPEICDTACAGEPPAYSLTPPGLPGYEAPECGAKNIVRARRLLAEAGYPEGRGFPKLEILYNTHESHQTIAELIRKQWQAALGVNVATRNEEWSTYNNSLRQGQYDIARRAWGGDYLDPNTFLDQFITGGANNDPQYDNPEYDALIEAAKTESDPQARLAKLHDAEAILVRDLPILPIYFYVSRNLVRPRVRGLYNNVLDQHPLWALWIDDNPSGPNEYMAPDAPAMEGAR